MCLSVNNIYNDGGECTFLCNSSQGYGRCSAEYVCFSDAPVVSIASSASEVTEGKNVTFTCSTDAEPPVVADSVYLALNDQFLPEARLYRNGEQFVLMNVSR